MKMKKWIEAGNSLYNLDKILWVENNEKTNQITLVFENGNEASLRFDNTCKWSSVERNEVYKEIKKKLLL